MGFYRLSEDLDFSIPICPSISRTERSNKAQPFKSLLNEIANKIPNLSLSKPLSGSNNSTQYNAEFEYISLSGFNKGTIQFEIGLREELVEPISECMAQTVIFDPYNNESLIPPYLVKCLSINEAYAEKMRAAFSRKKPAIRDLFDIDYAINSEQINFKDKKFRELVQLKLNKPEKRIINLSEERKKELSFQVQSMLKPVLRIQDFNQFNFDLAWKRLCEIGEEFI